MPLPLIPAAMAMFLSGGAGCGVWLKAHKSERAALSRFEEKKQAFDSWAERYRAKGQELEAELQTVGRTKLRGLKELGNAAELLQRSVAKGQSGKRAWSDETDQWKAAWNAAQDLGGFRHDLFGAMTGAGAGSATAAGAFGLVNLFGSASTGTAISTLTGVAAKNATLAWLGGGATAVGGGGVAAGAAVLGGFVAGPGLLVLGVYKANSAKNRVSQIDQQCTTIDEKITEMSSGIEEINKAIVSAHELRSAMLGKLRELRATTADTNVASSEEQYRVHKIASDLAALVDTPLL